MPGKPSHVIARRIIRDRYGELPWPCWLCGDPIFTGATVHHKNGNHDDHRPRNLVAVHRGCHTKIHRPWEHITEEGISRRRMAHLGTSQSEEMKSKLRKAHADGRYNFDREEAARKGWVTRRKLTIG